MLFITTLQYLNARRNAGPSAFRHSVTAEKLKLRIQGDRRKLTICAVGVFAAVAKTYSQMNRRCRTVKHPFLSCWALTAKVEMAKYRVREQTTSRPREDATTRQVFSYRKYVP